LGFHPSEGSFTVFLEFETRLSTTKRQILNATCDCHFLEETDGDRSLAGD
jgi:hypothetical protein